MLELKGLGVNPFVQNSDEIYEILRATGENVLDQFVPDEIFFYGTGCSTEEKCQVIEESLFRAGFHIASVNVQHDLLAAARALFSDREGIACILGTGSSSGIYNGSEITDQVMSLGYVLGDEGAGVDMGKRLLVEVLKERMPSELIKAFKQDFIYSNQEIKNMIYSSERPNQFIASFTPFLNKNIEHQFCRNIVEDSFKQFISLNIDLYEEAIESNIGFVGTVAYSFKDILESLFESRKLQVEKILKEPMEGLIEFHSV